MSGLTRFLVLQFFEHKLEGEFYNTAVVIGPNGEIIRKYRKMSILFVTTLLVGREKFSFKPDNRRFPAFQTPFGINIGILICYEGHFPQAVRDLAHAGAHIVFVPNASTAKTKYL